MHYVGSSVEAPPLGTTPSDGAKVMWPYASKISTCYLRYEMVSERACDGFGFGQRASGDGLALRRLLCVHSPSADRERVQTAPEGGREGVMRGHGNLGKE